MIKISEETRQEYLKDTCHKNLYITVDDEPGNITNINWYIWHFDETVTTDGSATVEILRAWHDQINQQYLRYADYLYISCRVKYSGDRSFLSDKYLRIYTSYATGNSYIVALNENTNKWAIDALMGDGLRLYCRIDRDEIPKFCRNGDPEYDDERYPRAYVQMYLNAGGVVLTIDQVQLQCEYKNYTRDELYPTDDRLNYKLPYLGYNSFASNNTIQAIVRRPAEPIEPIYNQNILKESQRLSESICSQDKLKIGIYEISLMNRLEQFNGRIIRPYIATKQFAHDASEFHYSEINWMQGIENGYQPDSAFTYSWDDTDLSTVFSVPKSVLGSINPKYLTKGTTLVVKYEVKITGYTSAITPTYLHTGIELKRKEVNTVYFTVLPVMFSYTRNNYAIRELYITVDEYQLGNITDINSLVFSVTDENDHIYSSGTADITMSIRNIQIKIEDDAIDLDYDKNECIEWRGMNADMYVRERQRGIIDKNNETIEAIPLGKFLVNDATINSARTYKRNNIIAYDDLYNLSVNASNWYKMYMFGISLDGYSGGGYEYTRQMYSTYWNIMSALMLESRKNHTEKLIYSQEVPNYKPSSTPLPGGGGYYGAIKKSWDAGDPDDGWFFEHLWYGEVHLNISEQVSDFLDHPLVMDLWYEYPLNYHYGVIQEYHYVYSSYRHFNDVYGRGIYNRACILVDETLPNNKHNKFCVDNGDYFMLSPDCISVDIRYACTQYPHTDLAGVYKFLGGNANRPGVQLYSVTDVKPDLINASVRLAYYNYDTKEIFDSDSGITARDVIRSLMEINGCFLNSDRDGNLAFVYCSKGGLYPSDTLYPSDDLYPEESNLTLPTANYIKSDYADYATKIYGKIQIRKMSTSDNSLDNVVQWEYTGDTEHLNTYVIDDNVFYSGTNMVYNKDGMPEVETMLANMFNMIRGITYTPNITLATGLPWLEPGDSLNILTHNGGYETFLFRRTMNGIQMLKDTLESYGEEIEQSVDTYAINTYTDTPIRPKWIL